MGDHLFSRDTRILKYPTWACRVSSSSSGPSSLPPKLKSDVAADLIVRSVTRTCGGQQLDFANLEWLVIDPLINRISQPSDFTRMADVLFPSRYEFNKVPIGFTTGDDKFGLDFDVRRVFIGDYVGESESVEEHEIQTGRVELHPYHFGKVFRGPVVKFNDTATDVVVTGADMLINPMVDGIVYPNRSSKTTSGKFVWIDPEIHTSLYAVGFHDQNSFTWTLYEWIRTICAVCNPAEEFIRNPIISDTDDIFQDVPELHDIRLESGHYLPFYLDAVLHPIGFNWFVDANTELIDPLHATESEFEKPIIKIFRRGYGRLRYLNFQPPGEELRVADQTGGAGSFLGPGPDFNPEFRSDVNSYQIDRQIGNSISAVRVVGDRLRAEVTVPLYPAWAQGLDAIAISDLAIDKGELYPANKHVHRLWVANEGAGFSGLRTTLYPIGDPPDFSQVFSIASGTDRYEIKTVARKRPMEPPLTFQGSATERVRRDLFLQYSIDSGVTWIEVTFGYTVLPDQIGVIFTNNEPPSELYDDFLAGTVRLRITGTIASDHSLTNVGTDVVVAGQSAQGRENLATLHYEHKFRHWFVVQDLNPDRPELNTSPFRSALQGETSGAEVHDDRQAIIDFAAEIIKPMLHAEYDGSFTMPGWATDYQIGDLLVEIKGRNISLNQSVISGEPAYMQITGIEYSFTEERGPMTTLVVDRGTRYVSDESPSRRRRRR